MDELKIEILPIKDLKPYDKNSRKHDQHDITKIAQSIKNYGFNDPIGIWSEKNIIVEGHGRLIAAQQIGLEYVPVIRLDHLTDKQRREYAIMHNRSAEFSEWDMDILTEELAFLDFDGIDLEFDIEQEEQTVEEDDFEEDVPEEPKSKIGQVYKLGNHRLMCGDSTKVENLNKLFEGETIDLVMTDPPYGISVVKGSKICGDHEIKFGNVGGGNIVEASNYMQIKGDETTETAKDFFNSCVNVGITNFILFGGNYFTDFLEPKACWVVWDKENTGNFADVELAWTSFDKGAKLYKWLWNGLCRKGDRKTEGTKRVHPTQKPVGLIAEILNDFSEKGQNIFDGFGGSGSTLIACEQTGRKCFMIEYEPHYIDVIIARWENLTGEKAELLTE